MPASAGARRNACCIHLRPNDAVSQALATQLAHMLEDLLLAFAVAVRLAAFKLYFTGKSKMSVICVRMVGTASGAISFMTLRSRTA
jgi:hypothetical protein